MRVLVICAIIGVMMLLNGCNSNSIESYAGTKPEMKFDRFFNGPLKGTAIVQDRSGKVIKTFTVDMVGRWDGDQGLLEEHFVYSDGKTQDRVWKITKLADDRFIGTAPDIVGEANGQSKGQAIQWNYVMTVPVDDKTYDLSFDDWMYAMDDNLVINRSEMSKFGFRVGEITIVIQKHAPK